MALILWPLNTLLKHEDLACLTERQVAVLVDDMIDTAGTITNSGRVLHQEGAREVYACATHAVFSPPAIERLSSGVFQEVRGRAHVRMHT